MRRHIVRITLLLILGAVVNIAVAWGCVLGSPSERTSAGEHAGITASNFFGYPECWPGQYNTRSFGYARSVVALPREEMLSQDGWWHGQFIVRSGWPMHSFEGRSHGRYSRDGVEELPHDGAMTVNRSRGGRASARAVPYRPVWPNIVISSVFYSGLIALLVFTPYTARRLVRRRRGFRGLCELCAYPIGVSPVCTECGAAVRRRSSCEKSQGESAAST